MSPERIRPPEFCFVKGFLWPFSFVFLSSTGVVTLGIRKRKIEVSRRLSLVRAVKYLEIFIVRHKNVLVDLYELYKCMIGCISLSQKQVKKRIRSINISRLRYLNVIMRNLLFLI